MALLSPSAGREWQRMWCEALDRALGLGLLSPAPHEGGTCSVNPSLQPHFLLPYTCLGQGRNHLQFLAPTWLTGVSKSQVSVTQEPLRGITEVVECPSTDQQPVASGSPEWAQQCVMCLSL